MSKQIRLLFYEILHVRDLLLIMLIAFIYVAIPVYLMNYQFAVFMLSQNTNILSKAYVLWVILQGLFTAFTPTNLIFMCIAGILVGINIVLLGKIAKKMKRSQSRLKIAVGGSGVISLLSAGCASCGISVASVFGLGAGLGSLPFGNSLVYVATIGILIFTVRSLLTKLQDGKNCVIPKVI